VKTEALIEALARGPLATDPRRAARRGIAAIAAGALVSAAAMLILLARGPISAARSCSRCSG
jgi:hypothetical protein